MYELAAFRAVQGIGAGGLFSLALAIIGDIVPPRERAKYQGYFLAVFGTVQRPRPGARRLLRRRRRDPRHHRLALDLLHQRADRPRRDPRGRPGCCTCRTTAPTTASTGPARSRSIVGLVPLLTVAEQGRELGLGLAAALALLRHRR